MFRRFITALFLVLAVLPASKSMAQTNPTAGIAINATGELRMITTVDPTLKAQALSAEKLLGTELCKPVDYRYISLTRLEKAIEDNNFAVTDEMKYLAGLQRIEYVFYLPQTNDVVIAGPAEGWIRDSGTDRVIGVKSGRPVVQLQDLVAALRLYAPEGDDPGIIGCTIDPTQEGLERMQKFIRSIQPNQINVSYIRNGLVTSLGMHTVRIFGVNPNTHFAKVLVEADYRMKLIGIGLEKSPAAVKSFISAAGPTDVSRNALVRWYFVPNYECVRMSPDGNAMKIEGQGVKLVGEDEVVTHSGDRQSTAGAQNRASRVFTRSFTERYEKVATVCPVYAELRNLIDLSIVAAYMRQEDIFGKAKWDMPVFGDEQKYSIETGAAPKFAPSACAAYSKGGRLMTPIGGGIEIHPAVALNQENLISGEDDSVEQTKQAVAVPEGRWWWN